MHSDRNLQNYRPPIDYKNKFPPLKKRNHQNKKIHPKISNLQIYICYYRPNTNIKPLQDLNSTLIHLFLLYPFLASSLPALFFPLLCIVHSSLPKSFLVRMFSLPGVFYPLPFFNPPHPFLNPFLYPFLTLFYSSLHSSVFPSIVYSSLHSLFVLP